LIYGNYSRWHLFKKTLELEHIMTEYDMQITFVY
jgi:hypothetical protein